MENQRYLTIRALTKYIKRKFDADPHLASVLVKGEISNFKIHSNGHMYFTLKDEHSRIMAVMFAKAASQLRFHPENGMHVLVRGRVTVYEMSGQYQIYVDEMQPDGIGELFLAYEQLKSKLEKEGLFHPERKKPIPAFPETIGVITSPTGAAVRDIITTLQRRYPIGKIVVIPALVQGKNASQSIAGAIRKANEANVADVLIVGRGGGSIEELWAFNEEIVARAIVDSRIPVISAVGHETDVTIADFAADLRAATPTAAAELAVPHMKDLLEKLMQRKNRLYRAMAAIVKTSKNKLNYLEQSYLFRNPERIYEQKWLYLDRLAERLHNAQSRILLKKQHQYKEQNGRLLRYHPLSLVETGRKRLQSAERNIVQSSRAIFKAKAGELSGKIATLEALNPLNILKRGFSLAYTDDGKLVKSIDQSEKGENITIQLADGRLFCTINEKEKGAQYE
jgi:exodeoxyribonuclease VII large subunit